MNAQTENAGTPENPSGHPHGMTYAENILGLIGNTPLVKLNKVTEGLKATILVKPEYLNPGGSVKDRIALKMIENAEAEGKLSAGGTVVEPTSGNTGVGLAMVAQLKGYRSVFVTPDKVGEEKRDVLRAYGAEVVVTKTSVAPESEESYYGVANRLERDIPGAYQPNQFFNPSAPESHYETTGPEIWRDTAGRLTHVVIGAGTGGTITGAGRFLKEVSADRDSGPVTVIAADPDGSIYSGGTGRPYSVEGVGEDMWPGNYDPSVPDEVLAVDDAASFEMTRRLAAEEGLLVGGSSGMAVVAGLRAAQDLGEDDVMVIVLPDSGRGYLGKIFNEGWMDGMGFSITRQDSVLPAEPTTNTGHDAGPEPSAPAAWDARVGDILAEKSAWLPGALPSVVTAPKDATLSEAISTMNRYGVDALPVVGSPRDDLRVGEILGAVDVATLTDLLASGQASPSDTVFEHVGSPLPKVNVSAPLSRAREALRTAPAVMATHQGVVTGIVTLHDLLARVAR